MPRTPALHTQMGQVKADNIHGTVKKTTWWRQSLYTNHMVRLTGDNTGIIHSLTPRQCTPIDDSGTALPCWRHFQGDNNLQHKAKCLYRSFISAYWCSLLLQKSQALWSVFFHLALISFVIMTGWSNMSILTAKILISKATTNIKKYELSNLKLIFML